MQNYINLLNAYIKKLNTIKQNDISKPNYLAILTLETLGMKEPSQAQIEIIEIIEVLIMVSYSNSFLQLGQGD